MRITTKGKTKDDEKLEELARDVNYSSHSFVTLIAALQDEVAKLFIEEFGVQGAIDVHSISKMARIMSKYAASDNFRIMRKYLKCFQNLFDSWQHIRKDAMGSTRSQREEYSVIPAKLCFVFFYNGELCKAVVSLLDYVELCPDDNMAMEAAVRWLIFLGETELVEKKMKAWKMDKTSADLREVTKLAICYLSTKEKRAQNIEKLTKIRDRLKAENVRSFPRYELASYLSWICSTLSNVPVSTNLEGCDFPDRLSQLTDAVSKADSIIRNRVPGLAAWQFDNTFDASIFAFLEEKRPGTPSDYIHLGSSVAWHFEMRRELALVSLSTAQARDSMSSTILNMRIAIKSASHFRILQAANIMSYYALIVGEPGFDENLRIMKASCVNLISADPIVVHCSTPVKNRVPSRCQTPLPGQKRSSSRAEENIETMMQDITDRMAELDFLIEKPFHPISRSCGCNVCLQFQHSSTFAAEYMFAYCMYSDFSQDSMRNFNVEFGYIRERDMKFQMLMHRDPTVRPRPNVIQNEVFGLCVVQWLIRKIDAKDPADEESLSIYKNADKIVRYLPCRTVDLTLAVHQLARQFEFPQDCNYSWMQPVVRKPLVKMGIDRAVDIIRAVSPFGRRPKTSVPTENKPIDEERYKTIKMEMRSDMSRYAHVLYRDWRSRMFPYVGRTSEDPWESAYAWAESTSIGCRNAVQVKTEKCRRGLVTISGQLEFRKCVEQMPDDMTLVQIAMADNKQIYLIKLHSDREPIIMPLAHFSYASELMDKFQLLLDADESIAKDPGDITPQVFWDKRKAVDARMKTFVEEVQKNFLDVSASLLMPSGRLGTAAADLAAKIHRISRGGLRFGEAKDIVYLAQFMDAKSWEKLCLRFCEMRTQENPRFIDYLPTFHTSSLEALQKDGKEGSGKEGKKYTYFVICSQLSHFCWERLPIFEDFPYVGRQVSIHSTFSQLAAMKTMGKKIPLQIDVQNAYYVLDPENNLGDTKRRMLEYINKFQWSGTVGAAPNTADLKTALAEKDAFVYIGHGSGSAVMPRSLIKQSTCNAISMLMGCGSVRTIPQSHGFDGKTVLLDYAMAKCPLIVGCLWTVTDGEIDRFLMRMLDDCFERTQNVDGVDKLRQLSEAMHEARSKAKLRYLTGAAVVMYGLPVVSKAQSEKISKSQSELKENRLTTPVRNVMPAQAEKAQKTPSRDNRTSQALKTLGLTAETPKTPERILRQLASKPVEEENLKTSLKAVPKTPKNKAVEVAAPTFHDETGPSTRMTLRSRTSVRTPSRPRQNN